MQWKNTSLKYEFQTERLILKVLTPGCANAVLNFQNRNRESFEAYEPTWTGTTNPRAAVWKRKL